MERNYTYNNYQLLNLDIDIMLKWKGFAKLCII